MFIFSLKINNITITEEIGFLQTPIISLNKELIHVWEVLGIWLYAFYNKGECFNEDYSKQLKTHFADPLNWNK